jgi:hypothetical protein
MARKTMSDVSYAIQVAWMWSTEEKKLVDGQLFCLGIEICRQNGSVWDGAFLDINRDLKCFRLLLL